MVDFSLLFFQPGGWFFNFKTHDGDSIQIFGPGEAKSELEKRLKSKELGERIIGVETVDKMTDRQIAAKVRERLRKK